MKLQHIRKSLEDIKEDDLIIIEELKNKISDLEQSLNKKYVELDEIEIRKNIINNLLDIKDNKKKLFRILRPVLEFVLMLIASFLTIITVESLSMILIILLCFILGLSADALNIIQKDYSKIVEKDDSSLIAIIKALCKIFIKRNILSTNMEECLMAAEAINMEIREMEQNISMNRSRHENLKDEVSYIEGNAHAINCLINKYKFEDMNDENALVRFIEGKKELKKSINPAGLY